MEKPATRRRVYWYVVCVEMCIRDSLKAGLIRLIGDPAQRYQEDPVRMLRAVRFAAKLGFRFDPATEAPLHRLGNLLAVSYTHLDVYKRQT